MGRWLFSTQWGSTAACGGDGAAAGGAGVPTRVRRFLPIHGEVAAQPPEGPVVSPGPGSVKVKSNGTPTKRTPQVPP